MIIVAVANGDLMKPTGGWHQDPGGIDAGWVKRAFGSNGKITVGRVHEVHRPVEFGEMSYRINPPCGALGLRIDRLDLMQSKGA